jgi:ketosteroid isomerase-like protein
LITPQGAKQAFVLVTNVYHKTPQGWRMVVHHASPGTQNDMADVGDKPVVFH